MPTVDSGNFSFTDPVASVKDGDTITGGNFMQLIAGTGILKGLRLTIYGGNWCNVKPDPNWTILGGSWSEWEFCANARPELVAKGLLAEPVNCPHRSSNKSWQRIEAPRFRELKDHPGTKDNARIQNKKDSYGLPAKGDGELEQYEYTYQGVPGRTGVEVLTAAMSVWQEFKRIVIWIALAAGVMM